MLLKLWNRSQTQGEFRTRRTREEEKYCTRGRGVLASLAVEAADGGGGGGGVGVQFTNASKLG